MAAVTTKTIQQIVAQGINDAFDEAYKEYEQDTYSGYRLEQCGKQWRVMHYLLGYKEAKTDWMNYKEAEALRKLFEASTD